MNEELKKHFSSFAFYGNLWSPYDDEALSIFTREAVLADYYLDEDEFISYFEEYCKNEYEIDGTKTERAKKWYKKFQEKYSTLKYLSKH